MGGVINFLPCYSNFQTNATPTSASGRPLRVGHYRQYYHTWSSLPIHPNEFDIDSEEEDSTSWLYQYYERNIAEFTDVNAGACRPLVDSFDT